MREHTKIILWVVLAAFLATIFLVWGMQESMDRNQVEGNSIAVIDDEPIPLHLFDQTWSQQVTQYRSSLGSAFTDEMAEGLKAPILREMIRQRLMFREAERENIGTTPEEIVSNIKSLPVFRTADGRFDEQRYRNAVDNPDTPWSQVESDIRKQLILMKLRISATAGVRLTDAELKQVWQRVKGTWTVRAAEFSPSLFESKVKVYENELRSWYTEHRSDYEKPETVTVRHILIGLKSNATADEEKKAREKIEAVRRQVKGSDSFSRLATDHSEDPGSAVRGGQLGTITRGMMVPEFEKAAFALKKDEVSPVIKTQYGLHIIYCDDHTAGQSTTLESAKDSIRRSLIRKKALAVAALYAQQLSDRARGGEAWEKISFKHAPFRSWSGEWRQNTPLGPFGKLDKVSDRVFLTLLPGETCEPVEDNGRIYVVQAVSVRPASLDPKLYTKERGTLHLRMLQEKQSRVFEEWIDLLEKRSRIVNNLKDFLKRSDRS